MQHRRGLSTSALKPGMSVQARGGRHTIGVDLEGDTDCHAGDSRIGHHVWVLRCDRCQNRGLWNHRLTVGLRRSETNEKCE